MLKLVFIDRDGVINKDPGGWTEFDYVTDPRQLKFLPGALKALALLNRSRVKVVIVSNQAGVSKGYFTKEKLAEVNSAFLAEIGKTGGRIEEVCYCIHRDEDNCSCRKPKPGMLEKALAKYRVRAEDTYIIGDSYVDVMAGNAAGMKTVFVLSGKTTAEEMKRRGLRPDYVFPGLLQAVEWILGQEKRRSERAMKRKAVPREKPEEEGPR
jgi:D-glycero-D-manno-heptose 1,7-bisphosphate phosphatase